MTVLRRAAVLAAALLLALPGAASAQQPKGTNTDAGIRKALLAQRDAVTNWPAFKDANKIVGWEEAVPDVCSWSGVNCTDSGMVYRIDWSCDNCLHCPLIGEWDFNLCAQPLAQGRLAPELASISSLRQVYIKGQNLSGPLPDAWAADGAFLNLTDLAIENNSFTGSLPASWGRAGAFPNVWRIWLDDNKLTGTLPPSWGGEGALKNLTWLKLHNNFLEGGVPAEWGQPTAFVRLNSSSGNEGVCPTGIRGNFQKCEITLANNTALCGPVPPNLVPFVCAEDKGDDLRATCVAQPDGSSGSGTNTGAIVGGVIGGLVVVGGATFAFIKLRGHKSLQGWKKESLDGHGLPVHQAPSAAGGGSTAGGAVYQPSRLPATEPNLPGFDGVDATGRQ
ncbi:hypothetical protein COHA_000989 [Chlorella ohadii]|uniref:Uncharacterized protein n=1 Tax=Chlorella ohadii TaxID=2649997 RepID=A0AAD5H9M8_9CHLO|nr:hypothetical protein COHA_000989 [Chlorella ohadii]